MTTNNHEISYSDFAENLLKRQISKIVSDLSRKAKKRLKKELLKPMPVITTAPVERIIFESKIDISFFQNVYDKWQNQLTQ